MRSKARSPRAPLRAASSCLRLCPWGGCMCEVPTLVYICKCQCDCFHGPEQLGRRYGAVMTFSSLPATRMEAAPDLGFNARTKAPLCVSLFLASLVLVRRCPVAESL